MFRPLPWLPWPRVASVLLESLRGILVLFHHLGGTSGRNLEVTFGQRQAGVILFARSFRDISGTGTLGAGNSPNRDAVPDTHIMLEINSLQ